MKIRLCPAMKAEERTPEDYLLDAIRYGGQTQESPITYYFDFSHKKVYAKGCDIEGGFLVLKGSLAAKCENSKLNSQHKKLRKELIDSGVFISKDSLLEFIRPYLFKNEYEATGVIAGNNTYRKYSGIWRDQEGRTPLENRFIGVTELEAKYIQCKNPLP
ncbi:MAG: DUF4357 domain-containing protein [Planctomycetes bacterium]|nr:DUF4357 domain-containing protein [Planctomycetota bacterium]MBU1517635.1 DUF4357 domain-containing protein [Planctomycetota bacterium]MBU2457197.1 DUF4357 domain-containing protein [Planctomycetota bacterium]MBU2597238.1 DUF4357 domain-containing protein [Planctomycetota bacterium]